MPEWLNGTVLKTVGRESGSRVRISPSPHLRIYILISKLNAAMRSIVLFGDSLFGRFGRDYVLQLEEAIQNVTVYNCATGGFNTRDGLKRADFIAQLQADYVCLSFGSNDASPAKGQPVPLEEFAQNLVSIIKSFTGSKIILFPCPPVYDPNDPMETKKFNDVLVEYNAAIKNIAKELSVDFIDSEAVYGKLLEKGEIYHLEDGLHLNNVGYQRLIDEFTRLIK